jgi:hypothetical protein
MKITAALASLVLVLLAVYLLQGRQVSSSYPDNAKVVASGNSSFQNSGRSQRDLATGQSRPSSAQTGTRPLGEFGFSSAIGSSQTAASFSAKSNSSLSNLNSIYSDQVVPFPQPDSAPGASQQSAMIESAPLPLAFFALPPQQQSTAPAPSQAVQAASATSTASSSPDSAALESIKEKFMQDIGGPNQDPNDPAYLARWKTALEESDARFRATFGREAFIQYDLLRSQTASNQ